MTTTELVALLHLASPALPIGAFSYSQGFEAALDANLIRDADTARDWIASGLTDVLAHGELPFLAHQLARWHAHDADTGARERVVRREPRVGGIAPRNRADGLVARAACASLEWGDAARRATLAALKPVALPTAFAYGRRARRRRRRDARRIRVRLGREPDLGRAQGGAARPARRPAHHRRAARRDRRGREARARDAARRRQHVRAAAGHPVRAARNPVFAVVPLLNLLHTP
jgi:hypothetical protein